MPPSRRPDAAYVTHASHLVRLSLSQAQELKGHDYDSLREFIHKLEVGTRMDINVKTRKAQKDHRPPPSSSEFVFFEENM